MLLEEADGIGNEREVFLFGDAERTFHVKVPGFAEDGDGGRTGFDERAHVAIFLHRVFGEAGRTERGEAGVLELELTGAGEEVLVFGIGPGPSTLNVVDAQLIQFLRNDELVIHGEGDGFALRAVSESGIES